MLPCIPSTWDAGWLEWTGEHHKWAEDRIKQSTSRCYPNFACKSHCAAPLKSLFGGSIVKRCRSLKRDPKRLWCMNLCFKPVKLNPLNPNQTFIRHLKGAVYLRYSVMHLWLLGNFDTSRYNKGFHLRHTSRPEQPQQSTVVGRRGCIRCRVGRNFPRQFNGCLKMAR